MATVTMGLLDLPPELFDTVLAELDQDALVKMARVCKTFKGLAVRQRVSCGGLRSYGATKPGTTLPPWPAGIPL